MEKAHKTVVKIEHIKIEDNLDSLNLETKIAELLGEELLKVSQDLTISDS